MNRRCKGCGALLQYEQKDQIGYAPKQDAEYCQRCFRITHYDDVTISMKTGIDPEAVLRKVASLDALILWVVDLFDFEANLIAGLHRHLQGKTIVLVATKRDLLPETTGNQKLADFITARCRDYGIQISGLVICGDLVKNAFTKENHSLNEVNKAIAYYRGGKDVAVIGMANAGKSTLLNGLLKKQTLTTSRHPGTTLDVVGIDMGDYTLYDTPGLTRKDSYLTVVNDSLLKQLIPDRRLKARSYQLYEDQSLAVGGLARLDLLGGTKVTCVAYFASALKLHRGKASSADALWQAHMGELLSPALHRDPSSLKRYSYAKGKDKVDVVIHGLGWFCISGDVKEIHIYVDQAVNVTFRKAMI